MSYARVHDVLTESVVHDALGSQESSVVKAALKAAKQMDKRCRSSRIIEQIRKLAAADSPIQAASRKWLDELAPK